MEGISTVIRLDWRVRSANFAASLSLYGMCGLVWYYSGSLKDMRDEALKELTQFRKSKS